VRAFRVIVAGFILATWALADIAPDPDMELDGSSGDPPGQISFTADANGGGISLFQNNSNDTWISITVTFAKPVGPVNCLQSNLFANCTVSADMTSITYSGTGDTEGKEGLAFGTDPTDSDADYFHGIGPGQIFSINLNNGGSQTDLGGWTPKETFTGTAQIALPEPGSIALALFAIAGSLGLGYSRRRKKC
jgi:hypothetical protein